MGLARLHLARGHYHDLVSRAPELLRLAHEFGEDLNRAHIEFAIAQGCAQLGRREEAREHARNARDQYVRIGSDLDVGYCDRLLAALAEGA